MKYLLIILLLVAVVIAAGCVGGNKETVVTPTPQIVYVTVLVTPTPTATPAQDPIIGVWRFSSGDYDFRYRFNADGTQVSSSDASFVKSTTVLYGTWSSLGGNSYSINTEGMDPDTFIYDPARNTIYDTTYQMLYTPYQGDVAAGKSFPASTPTSSSQSSSSSSTHLSGSGDDVKSFTATGTGLRIFTMSHTGTRNFAVVLKDSGGNYMTLLANEIGSYSGKKSQQLTSGTYYLDITADGSWTIDISSM